MRHVNTLRPCFSADWVLIQFPLQLVILIEQEENKRVDESKNEGEKNALQMFILLLCLLILIQFKIDRQLVFIFELSLQNDDETPDKASINAHFNESSYLPLILMVLFLYEVH